MRDKAKYKAEIKKYKTDIRSRVSEHSNELERNQEYFQEQIIALTEERDDFCEQVQTARDDVFNEKERLRTDFSKKLAAEKKRMESRYGGKNTTAIRLQASLDKLQERVTQQLEEKERLREENETQLTMVNDQHRAEMEAHQDEIRKTRHIVDRERDDIRKSVQLFQTEKESALAVSRRERDQALADLAAEKDSVVQSLQNVVVSLKRDKELTDRDRERILTDTKSEHDHVITSRNRTIEQLKDTHARSIDQLKIHYEGKLSFLNDKNTKNLETAEEKHSRELQDKVRVNEALMNNVQIESVRQVQELADEIAIQKQKTQESEANSQRVLEQLKRENAEKIENIKREHMVQTEDTKRIVEKEHNEGVRDRDDTITELERLNHALGGQVGHFRSAMENMKGDTDRIKQQFVATLNKQKEEDEKAVKEREERITNIKAELAALHSRTTNQLDDARSKLNILTTQLQDAESRNKTAEDVRDNLQLHIEKLEMQRSSVASNLEDARKKLNVSTTHLQALELRNKTAEDIRDDLQLRVDKLEMQRNNMVNGLEDVRNKLNVSTAQRQAAEIRSKAAEDARDELQRRTDKLELQLNSVASNLEDTRKKLNVSTTQSHSAELRSKAAEDIRDALQLRVDKLELQRNSIADSYEQRIERMKVDFSSKANVNLDMVKKEYSEKLEVSERNAVNIADELKKFKAVSCTSLNSQRQELLARSEKESQTIRQELDETKAKLVTVNKSLASSRMQFVTQLGNMTKSNEEQASKLKEYSEKLEESQRNMARSETELRHIKSVAADTLNQQRRELLAHSEKESQAIRQELDETKAKLDTVTNSLAASRKQFVTQLDSITISNKEQASKSKEQIEKLTAGLANATTNLQTSRAQFANQLNAMSHLTSPEREELKNVKIEMEKKDKKLESLQKFSTDLVAQITRLRTELDTPNKSIEQEKLRLAAERKELEEKAANPIRDTAIENKLKKMRDDCIEALRKQKIEISELKQDNTTVHLKMSVLERKLEEKESALSQATKNGKETEASFCTKLEDQKRKSDEDLQAKTAQVTKLETMLSDAISKISK